VLSDVADQVEGGLGVVQPSVGGCDFFEAVDSGFAEVPWTLDRSSPKWSGTAETIPELGPLARRINSGSSLNSSARGLPMALLNRTR
jgi:hypothetical protein